MLYRSSRWASIVTYSLAAVSISRSWSGVRLARPHFRPPSSWRFCMIWHNSRRKECFAFTRNNSRSSPQSAPPCRHKDRMAGSGSPVTPHRNGLDGFAVACRPLHTLKSGIGKRLKAARFLTGSIPLVLLRCCIFATRYSSRGSLYEVREKSPLTGPNGGGGYQQACRRLRKGYLCHKRTGQVL